MWTSFHLTPFSRQCLLTLSVLWNLAHRPDVVVQGFDGVGTYLVIDVKTLDPSGDTHRVVSHTDSERLAAHARVERDCARDEYGPLPPRLRLLVLTVSVFGSFGRPAHAFFAELSRRTGGAVPPPLLPSATWATPRLAPFARMAVATAVRRGLASAVWSGCARASVR